MEQIMVLNTETCFPTGRTWMTLKKGDSIELMKGLESESIDLIFTDPPYGINKDGILNDDSLEVYHKALPELYRLLKDGSFFITFASIGRLPEFFMDNPFKYRWQYMVYINNGMVRGSLGFNRYMCVLIFQKGDAKLNKQLSDVFECSTSSKQAAQRQHPTEKPIRIIRKLIEATTKQGAMILDPFMGSGSTGIAAHQLKRRFIGYELSEEYFKIAEKRIASAKAQIRLSERL